MPNTRLEKAKAAFEAEQHKADLRRLKKACTHFDIALAAISMPFHETAHGQLATEIYGATSNLIEDLKAIVEKG
jgi:hypothetical protein